MQLDWISVTQMFTAQHTQVSHMNMDADDAHAHTNDGNVHG